MSMRSSCLLLLVVMGVTALSAVETERFSVFAAHCRRAGVAFTVETAVTGERPAGWWRTHAVVIPEGLDHACPAAVAAAIEAAFPQMVAIGDAREEGVVHMVDRALVLTSPLNQTMPDFAYSGPAGAMLARLQTVPQAQGGFVAVSTGGWLPRDVPYPVTLERADRSARAALTQATRQFVDTPVLWTAEHADGTVRLAFGASFAQD